MALELTDHEQLALAGLMRVMVRLDGRFSAEERAVIDEIAVELFSGKPDPQAPYRGLLENIEADPARALWQLLDRAGNELPSDDAVREAARKVTRLEARDAIYGAVYAVAAADTISGPEWELLRWLEHEWKIGES